MTDTGLPLAATNLTSLQERLLTKARDSSARSAAETLYSGRGAILRQTVMALLADAELPEHESPPEAILQVLTGRVRLRGQDREWLLETGDLIPIPPERHSVTALEDSVFLLTVRRAQD